MDARCKQRGGDGPTICDQVMTGGVTVDSSPSAQLPDSPLSERWLNDALSSVRGDAEVVAFAVEDIGAGTGFGGTVLRLTLTYSEATGAGHSAPDTVILKLPVAAGDALTSLTLQGVLLREALFYRDLASEITVKTPTLYYVEVAESAFAILFEDLGDLKRADRHNMPIADAKLALQTIAKLHAAFWQQPFIEADWLAPVVNGDKASRDNNLLQMERAIELLQRRQVPSEYLIDCARRIRRILPKMPEKVPVPGIATIVHGDFHADNLAVKDRQIVVYDWQLVAKGSPLTDVANLVLSNIEPKTFEAHKEELLSAYYSALLQAGVTNYSYKQMLRHYNDAAFLTVIKFFIVLGSVDLDNDAGADLLDTIIPRMEQNAIAVNALRYCKLMPLVLLLLKLVNFIQRK